MSPDAEAVFLFRWDGRYWGFLAHGQLHDRHGRHAGWIESHPRYQDVYDLSGHFLGELVDGQYVLRSIMRAVPDPLATRPPVPHPVPPDAPPDREAREPREGWADGLPWPLRPPEPIRL